MIKFIYQLNEIYPPKIFLNNLTSLTQFYKIEESIKTLRYYIQSYLIHFNKFHQSLMKSKTHIVSNKNLQKDTREFIQQKCKNDHFSYTKELPIRKNWSSYTAAFKEIDTGKLLEDKKIEEFRRKIAPSSLDPHLYKRSLHESTVHFSPSKTPQLPSLKIGSTYKSSFHHSSQQKIVKGKQRDGYFMKVPWHDSPSSNYRKSYEKHNTQGSLPQKGKAVEDHLKVMRRQFRGKSNYQESYSPMKNVQQNDSKDCIKNKDHLKKAAYNFKGKSQYKSRFDPNENKENQSLKSIKSIKSKKRLSLLPQIVPKNIQKGKSVKKLPKKSTKIKGKNIMKENQISKNASTHQRIFGSQIQNQLKQ